MFKSPPPILANVVVFVKGTVDGREAQKQAGTIVDGCVLERVEPRDD